MKYKQIQKSGAPSSVSLGRFDFIGGISWCVFGIVIILAIVNLVGTNALATQGVVLDKILSETNKTSKENQILAVEIGKISNLSYIESTATNLGFKRVKSNLIISGSEAVAALYQR